MDFLIFLFVLIILFIFCQQFFKNKENFYYQPQSLWWNSTRSTRNMSYDLRGDIPIPPSYVGPWNISSYAF